MGMFLCFTTEIISLQYSGTELFVSFLEHVSQQYSKLGRKKSSITVKASEFE